LIHLFFENAWAIHEGFGFKRIAADDLGKTGRMVGGRIGVRFHLEEEDLSPSFSNLPGCFTSCEPGANDHNGFHKNLFYAFFF
jgi:hypothetical protein